MSYTIWYVSITRSNTNTGRQQATTTRQHSGGNSNEHIKKVLVLEDA